MRNQKRAHITINGEPLCICDNHLMQHSTYHHRGDELFMTCGFRSTARARSAWQEIVKHRYWKTVKVAPGPCPSTQA